LSIAGILAEDNRDAAELLLNAFAATRSLYDDFVNIRTRGRSIALGLRGRSVSLDELLCEARDGIVMAGTLPSTLRSPDDNFSACNGTAEATQTYLNTVKGAFATLETGYAAILGITSHLIGIRDPLGQRPLFYTRTSSYAALSSSRKVLWALGNDEPQVHPSGVLTQFSGQTVRSHKIRDIKPPPPLTAISFEEASRNLAELVCNSVRSAVEPARRVGVLFSGGLDSSVIASAAKRLGLETHLYSVAFSDVERLFPAETAAHMLELDLDARLVGEEDIEEVLRHTVWAAESADTLQVSVAFPLDVATQAAVEKGETVLLSGSGADELFGGYSRYPQILDRSGEEALTGAMLKDVLKLSEADLLRDGAVGESNRIRLQAPFLNLGLVEFALNLPVEFKVMGARDALRKHILREAARKLDVPAEVVCSPKKAAQYSSGSLKAVRRLAQRRGLRAEEYLGRMLLDVRRDIAEKMRPMSA